MPRPSGSSAHVAMGPTVKASATSIGTSPASLDPDDYWNVLAYILDGDGMKPNGTDLNSNTAESINIATVDKQEQSSQTSGQARTESLPAGIAGGPGVVGSPPDPRQTGSAAAVVGDSRREPGR